MEYNPPPSEFITSCPCLIDRWKDEARKRECKYILVTYDTFSYEDYPAYCKDKKELDEKHLEHNNKNMQRIMGVIVI